ncbi:hypothetical protein BMF94_5884, partial [Rhodotorula taiwanensis]
SSASSQKRLRTLADIDPAVEAKLRRKIDRRILPVRANIGNAKIVHLERDLNMKGYDYNILLTAPLKHADIRRGHRILAPRLLPVSFYASYMVFELPCQMLTKWLGPGKTLPLFGFLFGLFTFAMAFVKSFGAGVAVRFFLGIAESAVFPGISYFLSRYYRKDELGFRLACYLVCTAAAGALGGLLASGILRISHIGWLTEWRLIFFIEGLASMVIAAAAWFLISDRPSACKWLTPEERELAEFRVMAENVGQHEAIDKMHSKAVKAGIWNANTLVIAIIFFLNCVQVQGVSFFLPSIIKSIYPERSVIVQQLLTTPPYVIGGFCTLSTGYLSWKTKRRGIYLVLSVPFLVAGFSLYLASMNPHIRYLAAFCVALGAYNFGAIVTAWTAVNVTSDTARASAIGTMVAAGNAGGLLSCWTMLPKDAPRYVPGNAFNLANSVVIFFLASGLILWQKRENKAKAAGRDDHRLVGKSACEIADLGQKHPDFRYAY